MSDQLAIWDGFQRRAVNVQAKPRVTETEANEERWCYHAGGRVDGAGRCLACGYRRPQGTRAARATRGGDGVTDLGGI